MPIAYSYLRFSHPSQADGRSIARQIAVAEEWCQKNGIPLDAVTQMEDRGSSAFTPGLRENYDRYALANFLRLIQLGRIPIGSYLIIENLDRLSREEEVQASHTLTGILLAGVKVVQLKPELILTDKSSGFDIMRAVMELSRGHSESVIKSERVGDAWAEKKRLARKDGKPMTKAIPSWLRIIGDRFEVIESRAKIIRLIYQWTIDGLGSRQIAIKLTKQNYAPFTRSKRWGLPFISRVLSERAVLGELQPMERKKKRSRPDGEPIPNYYPAIIEERTWILARAAREERLQHRGRHGIYVNVFAGLLRDAVNGGAYYARATWRGTRNRRILLNYEADQGRAKMASFPFEVFEQELLDRLQEVPASVLDPETQQADDVSTLAASRDEKEARLSSIRDAMKESKREIKTLALAAEELEDEIADLTKQIDKAAIKADFSQASVWGEGQSLMQRLNEGSESEQMEKRLRLRSVLRRSIHSIYLVVTRLKGKTDRVCIAQAFFLHSKKTRSYVIWYRRPCRMRPEEGRKTLDWLEGRVDLRNRSEAKRVRDDYFSLDESPLSSS